MKPESEILNELNTLSPVVAGIVNVNIFSVPEGYFENLSAQILYSVKQEEPVLAVHGVSPFQAPLGYFDSLADNILNRIKKQDIEKYDDQEVSVIITTIPKINVYKVPVNYFENLASHIVDKTSTTTGKLVSFYLRKNFVKYAAAAVFTGALAFGTIKFLSVGKPPAAIDYTQAMKTNIDGELAKISDVEIVHFLTSAGVDVDAAVAVTQMQDKIDTEELNSNNTESSEIDDLLNQLEENKTMN